MKSAANLSHKFSEHLINTDIGIDHRTAYELLMFLTELYEKQPAIFDVYQIHPLQIIYWIDKLDRITQLNDTQD